MDQLQPSDFTLLPQCAELLDLCLDSREQRAELARKMEAVTQHMQRLRTAVASLPGISISQRDQLKVLGECQKDLNEKLAELSEYGQGISASTASSPDDAVVASPPS
ncbi:hypothetical protein GGI00_000777 [Coemansia sp. RSA 2681]|nr:hypothetical protein GGI00_000777 [Coemansia sp. RSA 2681]KAJ2447473.1 hypothetical protein GGF42_005428 [Coemansia sp. RSA 2424]